MTARELPRARGQPAHRPAEPSRQERAGDGRDRQPDREGNDDPADQLRIARRDVGDPPHPDDSAVGGGDADQHRILAAEGRRGGDRAPLLELAHDLLVDRRAGGAAHRAVRGHDREPVAQDREPLGQPIEPGGGRGRVGHERRRLGLELLARLGFGDGLHHLHRDHRGDQHRDQRYGERHQHDPARQRGGAPPAAPISHRRRSRCSRRRGPFGRLRRPPPASSAAAPRARPPCGCCCSPQRPRPTTGAARG